MTDTALHRTPLHAAHKRLNAKMVPFAGWEMPVQYSGLIAEHQAVRQRAGIFDVSHMGQLELSGQGALEVANSLVAKDLARLALGRGAYTVCCNEQGGILDDLIAYRLEEQKVFVICNASRRSVIAPLFAKQSEGRCDFKDVSELSGLIALQGPMAAEILKLSEASAEVLGLKRFGICHASIFGEPLRIARTGYTGEDGFEIAGSAGSIARLWENLLERNHGLGLLPAGLGARDTLRLEAALALYGNEIDETTHPFEAGLGWVVNLEKDPFLGQSALRAHNEKPLSRKLVGLRMTERGNARHGYPIVSESGETIGTVTSGSPSPTLGYSIALAYVPVEQSSIGTTLRVRIREQAVRAEIVETPFYRRKK
jgi:aminomethyltransferase